MIYYILGVITGLLLLIPSLIIGLWAKPKVERLIRQTASKIGEKGKIFEHTEEEEELQEWVGTLKNE